MKAAIWFLALAACAVGDRDDLDDNLPEDGADVLAAQGPPPTIDQCGPLATQAAVTANAGLTKKVELSQRSAWVTFTEPATGATGDIITGLIRLINAVEPGGTISGAIHSIKLPEVALALGCAHQRGANVNLIVDGSIKGALATFLEANSTNYIVCNVNGGEGCFTSSPTAIMHSKIFTFSATVDPDGVRRNNVAWFGSANLTPQTGMNTANNTVTTFENAALKQSLDAYLLLMASKTPAPGRKVTITDGVDADGVASPSVSKNNDLVKNRLDKIDASAPCTIDVAEGLISNRPAVFDKLASLATKGCKVRVLGNDGSRENKDGETIFNSRREALRTMKAGGVRIKLGRVHDKLILIDAKVDGERKRLVFTGSHNLTASANAINDELFIGLRGASIYDAYVGHFNRVFNAIPSFF